jgi:deferrochelatase/peroxidase EfeB
VPGAETEEERVDLTISVPFYGQPHPPGIATPPQRYAAYMTFDMFPGTAAGDLQVLLARWSAAIAQLVAGKPIGQVRPAGDNAIGADTGEALGLAPASLTVTVGLGPGLFDDRFGLAARRPALLAELPQLPSDQLDPAGSGGDLSLQACADDPQVTYHAIRNLARMARSTVQTRWVVMGFGRASAGPQQHTPRNLLGFKDGTRNVSGDGDYDQFVWLREADWMTGGTYQVVRKIQMHLETWDADRFPTRNGCSDGPSPRVRRWVERRSPTPRTSPGSVPTANRRSTTRRTSGWPRTRTTAASRFSAGRTTTPTGSPPTGSWTRGCCSSPT